MASRPGRGPRTVWAVRFTLGALAFFLLGAAVLLLGLQQTLETYAELAVVLFVGGVVLMLLALYTLAGRGRV